MKVAVRFQVFFNKPFSTRVVLADVQVEPFPRHGTWQLCLTSRGFLVVAILQSVHYFGGKHSHRGALSYSSGPEEKGRMLCHGSSSRSAP